MESSTPFLNAPSKDESWIFFTAAGREPVPAKSRKRFSIIKTGRRRTAADHGLGGGKVIEQVYSGLRRKVNLFDVLVHSCNEILQSQTAFDF